MTTWAGNETGTSQFELRDVDFSRPNIGRITDHLLGGSHNFAVDRDIAHQLCEEIPDLPTTLRVRRSFARRAVRLMLDSGIRQFLDLGSGLPATGNVHEFAQAHDPGVRVVYVDHDPTIVAHGRTILADNERAEMVLADIREPHLVLDDPAVVRLIDFDRPLGLTMHAVLHHLPAGEDLTELVGSYTKILCSASYLSVSIAARVPDAFDAAVKRGVKPRSRTEVADIFSGFDIVQPGVVYAAQWRPEDGSRYEERALRMPELVSVGRWDRSARR